MVTAVPYLPRGASVWCSFTRALVVGEPLALAGFLVKLVELQVLTASLEVRLLKELNPPR